MDNKSFGEKIARLRKEKHLTQAQLAEKLHISNKTISRWETGEGYPEITLLSPLAEALGVTTDELLKEASKKNDSPNEKQERRPIAAWKNLTPFNKAGAIGIILCSLSILFNAAITLWENAGHDLEPVMAFYPLVTLILALAPRICAAIAALGVLLGLLNLYEKQYKQGIIFAIINFCFPYALVLFAFVTL